MSHRKQKLKLLSSSYDIEAFMKAVEKKDLLEIISFADQEATAAWRSVYRQRRSGQWLDDLPGQYEHALEELIAFLRAAGTYRPVNIGQEVFDRFVQLRQNLGS